MGKDVDFVEFWLDYPEETLGNIDLYDDIIYVSCYRVRYGILQVFQMCWWKENETFIRRKVGKNGRHELARAFMTARMA